MSFSLRFIGFNDEFFIEEIKLKKEYFDLVLS